MNPLGLDEYNLACWLRTSKTRTVLLVVDATQPEYVKFVRGGVRAPDALAILNAAETLAGHCVLAGQLHKRRSESFCALIRPHPAQDAVIRCAVVAAHESLTRRGADTSLVLMLCADGVRDLVQAVVAEMSATEGTA